MEKITLKEARAIVNSPHPFSVEAVTADLARGTGGRIIKSAEAIRRGSNHDARKHGTVSVELLDQDSRVITLHWRLIMYINKKQVVC